MTLVSRQTGNTIDAGVVLQSGGGSGRHRRRKPTILSVIESTKTWMAWLGQRLRGHVSESQYTFSDCGSNGGGSCGGGATTKAAPAAGHTVRVGAQIYFGDRHVAPIESEMYNASGRQAMHFNDQIGAAGG